MHVPALTPLLKSPVEQLVHTRSALAVPAVATYWPALHTVHALHVLALFAVLNVPSAHLTQLRSTVVVPSFATALPAMQVVLLTHGVAGFASSSQVPAAQATSCVVLPAHQPPAVQAWQVGGIELVPGAVWVVPGAHSVAGKHSATFLVVLSVPSGQLAHVRSALAEGVFVE